MPEQRKSIDDPSFWPTLFNYNPAASGHDVTPTSAMQVSTVYACVKILSETIASLPYQIFKRDKEGDSREVAPQHQLYKVIHEKPNLEQSAFDYWEMVVSHILLWGNHYSFIEKNGRGRISGLWPLDPGRVVIEAVESTRGALKINRYYYTRQDGQKIIFDPDEIWHVKDLSRDGLSGDSRITQAANAIGLAMGAEEHGSKYFANNASPGVLLIYPGRMKEDMKKELKQTFDEAHAGSGNAYKSMVLEQGLEIKHLGMNMADSQFLETRQFQVEDIARIFRVPTLLLQHSDKTTTYASSEQHMLAFVMHAVRPWAARVEQSFDNKFLEKGNLFFSEFNLNGLLRGDIQTRYEAYNIGRSMGIFSANDVRKLENLNPIGAKGDHYIMPSNHSIVDEKGIVAPPGGGGNNAGDGTPGQ